MSDTFSEDTVEELAELAVGAGTAAGKVVSMPRDVPEARAALSTHSVKTRHRRVNSIMQCLFVAVVMELTLDNGLDTTDGSGTVCTCVCVCVYVCVYVYVYVCVCVQ